MAWGFKKHDHAACVRQALQIAETRCADEGLHFTKTRRRVLELLLEGHKAIAAYDILDKLVAEGLGSQPPVVYRALDFLVTHGFAHKIEKLNAFSACSQPGRCHSPAFMICQGCDGVMETQTEQSDVFFDKTAKKAGFRIEHMVIEAEGLCPDCQSHSVV